MSCKLCVVTGGRAEYGLLRPLMRRIEDDPDCELQVVVTGTHLSTEHGLTYLEIESDGFDIDAKVEILLSCDTKTGIAKSMGLAVPGLAESFERLSPDMIVLLGDRFEALAAAQAAMIMQIPVAHLAGGDDASGTYDNVMRHCITKMASLHFVTHEAARQRVIQLGEDPAHVFNYGATAVDNILGMRLLAKHELEADLGLVFKANLLLVTYHPLTMDADAAETRLGELFAALDPFLEKGEFSILFTGANADHGGRHINALIASYIADRDDCHFRESLGQLRYLSAVKAAVAVVGNSSSGIYEAPYLNTPTVDIGSRQRGRPAPASVLHCELERASIVAALHAALAFEFDGIEMLYGTGAASADIFSKLRELVKMPGLAVKTFHDLRGAP